MRTRMKHVALVLALVLVSSAVVAAFLVRHFEPEGTYLLTVLNDGASTVSGGTLVVSVYNAPQTHRIPRLKPGDRVTFKGTVGGDCDYQVSVVRESGVASNDTLGYLTSGAAVEDTIVVADSSVSLRSGPWVILGR